MLAAKLNDDLGLQYINGTFTSDLDMCHAEYSEGTRTFSVIRQILYDIGNDTEPAKNWCTATYNECVNAFEQSSCHNVKVNVSVLYSNGVELIELINLKGEINQANKQKFFTTLALVLFAVAVVMMFIAFNVHNIKRYEDNQVSLFFVFMGAAIVLMVIGGALLDKFQ